jgi:addiction module HigA family antidote
MTYKRIQAMYKEKYGTTVKTCWIADIKRKNGHPVRLAHNRINKNKPKYPCPDDIVEEFLIPLEISAYRLSKEISIPQTRISETIKGKRRITADTALRFSKFFGNSAKFWLGLQDDFDIEDEKKHKQKDLNSIKQYVRNAE